MSTSEDPLQLGMALFQEQRMAEAIQVLSQVSPKEPRRYAEALVYLGRAYSKQRDFQKAAELLEEAYERNPQATTQYYLAEALVQVNRKSEAFDLLEEATQRDSSLTDAFIHLGILKEERGLLVEAIQCFEKALVNDSKAVVARYRLAKIAFDKGDLKRAATQAYLVHQIAGNYPPVHKLMGSIALALGDHRQAAVELCRVVELGEGDTEVFQRLGKAFANIGDLPQALMAFEQSIKRNPNQPQLVQVAARLAQRLEDYPRAAAYYFILLDDPNFGEMAKAALAKLEAQIAAAPPPPVAEEPPAKGKAGLKGKVAPTKLTKPKASIAAPTPGGEAKHILPDIPENPRFSPPKILEKKTEPLGAPATGSKFVGEAGFAPGTAPPTLTQPQPKPSRPAPTAPLSAAAGLPPTPTSSLPSASKKTAPLGIPNEKLSQVTDMGREKLSQVTDMGREKLSQVTDMGREKLQGMSRDVMSKVKQAPAAEKGFEVFNKMMGAFSKLSKKEPAPEPPPEPKFKLSGNSSQGGTGKLPPKPGPKDPKQR